MAEGKGITRDDLFPTKHFMQGGYGNCQTLGGALDQILKSQGGVEYLQGLIQIKDNKRDYQFTVTFPGRDPVVLNGFELFDRKLAKTEDLGVTILEKALLEVARRENRVPDAMKLFKGDHSTSYLVGYNGKEENLKLSGSPAGIELTQNLQREALAGNVMVSGAVSERKVIQDFNGNTVNLPAPHMYALYPQADGTYKIVNPHDNGKSFILSQEQLAANFDAIFVGSLPGKELNIDPKLKEIAEASAKCAETLYKKWDLEGAYSLNQDFAKTGGVISSPMTPEKAAANDEFYKARHSLKNALDKTNFEIGGPKADPAVLAQTQTRLDEIKSFRKDLESAKSNNDKHRLFIDRINSLNETYPKDTYSIYETCKAAKECLSPAIASLRLESQLRRYDGEDIKSTFDRFKREAQKQAESFYAADKPWGITKVLGGGGQYEQNVKAKAKELYNEKLLNAIAEKDEGIPDKRSRAVIDSILAGNETGRAMEITNVKSQGSRINIAVESDEGRITLTSNPSAEYEDGKIVGGYASMAITDKRGRTQIITDPAIIENTVSDHKIRVSRNTLPDPTRDVPKFDQNNQVVNSYTEASILAHEVSKGYSADYPSHQVIIKPQSGGEIAINFETNSTKVTSITIKDANGVTQTIKDKYKVETILEDLNKLPNDQYNNNRSNDWIKERENALKSNGYTEISSDKERKPSDNKNIEPTRTVSQVSDFKDHPHVAEARERAESNKTKVSTPEHNPAIGGNQSPNVAQTGNKGKSNSVT